MTVRPEPSPLARTTTTLAGIAILCLIFADAGVLSVVGDSLAQRLDVHPVAVINGD
mgnify:CR=1 FL=1